MNEERMQMYIKVLGLFLLGFVVYRIYMAYF
jgi:hypothetical protein